MDPSLSKDTQMGSEYAALFLLILKKTLTIRLSNFTSDQLCNYSVQVGQLHWVLGAHEHLAL